MSDEETSPGEDDSHPGDLVEAFVDEAAAVLGKASRRLKKLQSRTAAGLAAARAQHDSAVATFAAEVAAAEERNGAVDALVSLNVGGQVFATSLETLRREPDSMLGAWFSGRHEIHKTPDGHAFIDRDPTQFRHILNFLRNGARGIPKSVLVDDALRDELLAEAEFYQLAGLVELVSGPAARTQVVARVGGRVKAEEDELRALAVREPEAAALRLDALKERGFFVDVFAQSSTFVDESKGEAPAPLVLGAGRRGWRYRLEGVDAGAVLQPSLEEFQRNWRSFMLDGLAGIRWGGIVAAGGSVAACALCSPAWTRGAGNQPLGTRDQPRCWFLNKCFYSAEDDRDEYQFGGDDGVDVEKQWWCSRSLDGNARGLGELWFGEGQSKKDTSGFEESDVDLFLVGLDADEARSKIRHIHAILARNWGARKLSIVRTKHAITFVAPWPFRRVQVVLRLYKSAAEVLMGFDLDSCCACYDGSKVHCLPRWRRAVNSGVNLADPGRRSASYERRLWKYALRGFAVAVPAYDPRRVDSSVLLKNPSQTEGLARLLSHAADDESNAEKIPRPFVKVRGRVPNTDEHSKDRFETLGWSNYESSYEANMHPFHPRDDDIDRTITIHLSILADSHGMGASVPLVATKDINDALEWPASKCLHALGDPNQWGARRLQDQKLKSSLAGPIQFIAVDPMRQYVTGSFEPDDTDWYAQAYGE